MFFYVTFNRSIAADLADTLFSKILLYFYFTYKASWELGFSKTTDTTQLLDELVFVYPRTYVDTRQWYIDHLACQRSIAMCQVLNPALLPVLSWVRSRQKTA